MNKKTLKFYVALWGAKSGSTLLKLLGRNASFFPGKFALTICPNFLGILEKPKTIVGVTGTNGKTTVCNIVEDILKDNNYDFIDNKYGSNMDTGIATSLIASSTLTGKSKKQLAILEIDERSSRKIFPYVTPTYLACTNLFRDSFMRHGHVEFISSILTKYIPKETTLLLNGDDLIVSNLAPENQRKYYGIDRLETDTETCENIVRDIITCPKCDSKLVYDFVRYHHVGRAHCPNCDFSSPKIDYEITNLDLKNMTMTLRDGDVQEKYHLINNNIINIYNVLTAITILKQVGLSGSQINNSLEKLKIIETRYSEETVNGFKIVTNLAKGLNPVACSRVFDYVRKEKGNKAVFLFLDDLHEAAKGSENTAWYYDTDYEFLNDDSIKQVIVAGVRYLDTYVRLRIAGIPKEKISYERYESNSAKNLKLENIDTIFILHDLYTLEIKENVKQQVIDMIKKVSKENKED